MEKTRGFVSLRHARNFREVRVAGHKVDGFAKDAAGKIFILEFQGCRLPLCHPCFHKLTSYSYSYSLFLHLILCMQLVNLHRIDY